MLKAFFEKKRKERENICCSIGTNPTTMKQTNKKLLQTLLFAFSHGLSPYLNVSAQVIAQIQSRSDRGKCMEGNKTLEQS